MTASEAVGVSAPLFGSCSQGAKRGRPAALNTHLNKPCHLAASNSHGHAVGGMGTVPIMPEQGSTCLSLRAGEPQAPGSPCDAASAEGGKGRGVDQTSVHVQHPGLSMEDHEYLLSAAFVEDFGGTQEEGLQVPSALEAPVSNAPCDINAVSRSSEPWWGMSTDGALHCAEDVETGGSLHSSSIDHVDHGPVASVPTGLPMPEEDEWAALAQACACASPYKPPDAHAPPFRAAPQTQARAGGSQVELCCPPPLAPEASAHAPSPWHPVQRKDDQDMQQRQANAGRHSIPRADHIGAAATQGWERGAEPCKDFVYRQAGAGPHAGAGRGGRGGLGIWGRKKGMKRPFYLSLRGDKVVGSDAVKQSREDAEAVARGQTFTHLRGELSLAQRTRLEHAPSPSPECSARHLGFAAWGLPEEVVRSYEERGVRELFDWQVECLQAGNGRVLSGGNLVYSAPTSGGKTMVAELLMLRALTLREEGTALFVVPFIALAEEKARYFRRMWGALNLGVKSFHSEAGDASLGPDVHVAVCTIERANALVNQLLELGELRRLSIVVVDELHMIGDDHRGYLIEVMLAKLRLASTPQYQQQQQQGNNTALLQIVGLSATLPNLPQLAHWLAADLYVTDFRPVALTHYLLVDDALWQHLGTGTWQLARHLPPAPRDAETQRLLQLCQETVSDGDGVLVFCNSRRRTQNCAERIAEGLLPPPDREVLRRALVEKLRDCPVGLPAELQRLVGRGVAFHHAGMTMEERGLLEDGFRSGALCVLVATSTLAAGVNLPARRVIIRSRMQGSTEMDLAQFQQMCGRAGRLGLDKQGEAILMTTARDSAASKAFMQRSLPPMRSVLREAPGKGGITRAVLEVAAARMACSRDWLHTFMQCTLLAQQVRPLPSSPDHHSRTAPQVTWRPGRGGLIWPSSQISTPRNATPLQPTTPQSSAGQPSCVADSAPVWGWQVDPAELECDFEAALSYLLAQRFLTPVPAPQPGRPQLETTQLGVATFFSSMAPQDATLALADMQAASGGLVLSSDLHLLFLTIPASRWYFAPPYDHLCRAYGNWPHEVHDVAERVGLSQALLDRARHRALGGQGRWGAPAASHEDQLAVRFVNAVALHEKLQEVPLIRVSRVHPPRDTHSCSIRTRTKKKHIDSLSVALRECTMPLVEIGQATISSPAPSHLISCVLWWNSCPPVP